MCGAAGGLKRHLILSYFTKLVLQKLFKLNIFELVFDNLFIFSYVARFPYGFVKNTYESVGLKSLKFRFEIVLLHFLEESVFGRRKWLER